MRMSFRKDVTVLASLVALVSNMPLKCEIIHALTFLLHRKLYHMQQAFLLFRICLLYHRHCHKQQASPPSVCLHFRRQNHKLQVSLHSFS